MIEASNTLDSARYDYGAVLERNKAGQLHMPEVSPVASLRPAYLPSSTGGIGMANESYIDREESSI